VTAIESHRRMRERSGPDTRTFVLAPGAYAGGWLYQKVEPLLLARGHRVFSLTFTGLGDRAHEFSPDIDAMIHARDIIELIRSHELLDVTLVAHSYAGIPATAAADQIGPGTISRLIYIDALVPNRAMSWRDFHTAPQQKANLDNLRGPGEGSRLMPPSDIAEMMKLLGLSREDAELLACMSTPMPARAYDSPVTIEKGGYQRFEARTYIDCTTPPLPTIAQSKARVRQEQGWKIVPLVSGHNPMLSMPDQVAELLTA
jgi:pimeloyl-ACP methyl ester carboxylesterase